MSKIIGESSLVERINNARPGDPVVYVNLDFLESLPDPFEARAVELRFNKSESFTNVGSEKTPSWYPGTKLMYDIANARGIATDDVNSLEPYYTEVDISRMEMTATPCVMRRQTGYKSTKSGRVQQEDGSYRTIVRDHIEDAWIECVGLWDKEELASEGYAKTVKDQYGREGYNTEWNGKKTFHEYKYNTKYKRRVHFNDLLDKAMGKAETKGKMKVIRELACLKTGYTDEDLLEGRFIFAKIGKSSGQAKLEAAARVSALSHGIEDKTASAALFGKRETSDAAPVMRDVTPTPTPSPASLAAVAALDPAADQRAEMLKVLKKYVDEGIVVGKENKETAERIIGWLDRTPNATENATYWPKAIGLLDAIELDILPDVRISGKIKR